MPVRFVMQTRYTCQDVGGPSVDRSAGERERSPRHPAVAFFLPKEWFLLSEPCIPVSVLFTSSNWKNLSPLPVVFRYREKKRKWTRSKISSAHGFNPFITCFVLFINLTEQEIRSRVCVKHKPYACCMNNTQFTKHERRQLQFVKWFLAYFPFS
jgi:hypothetical protein